MASDDDERGIAPGNDPARSFERLLDAFRNDDFEVRIDAYHGLRLLGRAAEPFLLDLLPSALKDGETRMALIAIQGLQEVGAAASLDALFATATLPWPDEGFNLPDAAREALLVVEARLGIVHRETRLRLWQNSNRPESWPGSWADAREREASDVVWALARENRLHGTALAQALANARRASLGFVLRSFHAQETDPRDFAILLRAYGESRMNVSGALWRYGEAAEPFLIEMLDDGDDPYVPKGASYSLGCIGTERSLAPLRRRIDENEELGAWLSFTYGAIRAIEARLR